MATQNDIIIENITVDSAAMDFMDVEGTSSRETDHNGFIIVRDNPIIRAGVFQYKGSLLPGGDPNKVYNVYRPLDELTTPETLASFVGLPIFDEHEMVGGKYPRGAEERGAHGSILENLKVSGNDILAPLRIFSRMLKGLIDGGKRGLSLGYNCTFIKSSGEFCGIAYTYIQTNIRGNHLALVTQGRNGTAVLDEHDTEELNMADETSEKKDETVEAAPELTLAEVVKFLKAHAPMWQEVQSLMANEAAESDSGEADALDADTMKKDGDQSKAEDADEKKEEKKEAMDSADVNKLLDSRLASERKNFMKNMTARNELAKDLAPHIGTFACDAMDLDEVAAYGAEKLGLTVKKGQEAVAVSAYLQGAKKNAGTGVTYAMDSAITAKPKSGGLLGKRLARA